jgi:histidinol-phosphate aminotransferase
MAAPLKDALMLGVTSPRPSGLFVRPGIASLPAYDSGLSVAIIRDRFGGPVAKMDANENPLGPTPRLAAMAPNMLQEAAARYPDPDCTALKRALADHLGTAPNKIIIGNGSESLIHIICQAFLGPDDRVVLSAPSFSLYDIYCQAMGASAVKVPMEKGTLHYDVGAWQRVLEEPARLVVLTNPSNPIGCSLDANAFLDIVLAADPAALLIIDEAYFEYAVGPEFPDALSVLSQLGRQFIVLRTFSKAYGLAGLRVGYGIASNSDLIEVLDRLRTPYNVNAVAQHAAIVALSDQEHLTRTVRFTINQREKLASSLRAHGAFVAPSDTNFLFIKCDQPATEIVTRIHSHRLLVKAWRQPGYDNWIRVTIGLPEENEAFLEAFVNEHLKLGLEAK